MFFFLQGLLFYSVRYIGILELILTSSYLLVLCPKKFEASLFIVDGGLDLALSRKREEFWLLNEVTFLKTCQKVNKVSKPKL